MKTLLLHRQKLDEASNKLSFYDDRLSACHRLTLKQQAAMHRYSQRVVVGQSNTVLTVAVIVMASIVVCGSAAMYAVYAVVMMIV